MKRVLITALPLLSVAVLAQNKQPNLVFIMADQWRADAIGYNGTEPVKTPHLDQLSTEGVTFMNAVSGTPVSSPARAMLMTGMYPVQNGVTGNCNSRTAPYGVEMATDARCWSDVLSDKGYDLAYLENGTLIRHKNLMWTHTIIGEKWPGTSGVRPNAATVFDIGLHTEPTIIT